MFHYQWRSYWGPARIEDIERAESVLGLKFPQEYKKIVLKYDAATIDGDPYIKFFNNSFNSQDQMTLGQFYPLSHEGTPFDFASRNGFGHSYTSFSLQKGVVGFSETGRGDIWCFDYRTKKSNPSIIIYHLSAEHPSAEEFSIAANSFDDLLVKLEFWKPAASAPTQD